MKYNWIKLTTSYQLHVISESGKSMDFSYTLQYFGFSRHWQYMSRLSFAKTNLLNDFHKVHVEIMFSCPFRTCRPPPLPLPPLPRLTSALSNTDMRDLISNSSSMPVRSLNIFLKQNIFRPELAWQIFSQIYSKFQGEGEELTKFYW